MYSPKIQHFIGDFGHVDATQEEHFVPNRLFKISCVENYPEVEHPVLKVKDGTQTAGLKNVLIWHLRECLGVFETLKKYQNNIKKSNIHSKEQLNK